MVNHNFHSGTKWTASIEGNLKTAKNHAGINIKHTFRKTTGNMIHKIRCIWKHDKKHSNQRAYNSNLKEPIMLPYLFYYFIDSLFNNKWFINVISPGF